MSRKYLYLELPIVPRPLHTSQQAYGIWKAAHS